jgi:hypothetical protein
VYKCFAISGSQESPGAEASLIVGAISLAFNARLWQNFSPGNSLSLIFNAVGSSKVNGGSVPTAENVQTASTTLDSKTASL